MKKNLLLITAILIMGAFQIMAQCTPDNTITKPLVPDSATGLPHAYANSPYSTIIQLKVPGSAVYSGLTVNIDSIKIISVSGLPASFSYVCNTPNGSWVGNSYGCILLTGNPSISQQNTINPIVVNIRAYGLLLGSPQSVDQPNDDYKIVIEMPQGIADVNSAKFTVNQNTPNPFTSETQIDYNVSKMGLVNFKVFNMLGKEVFSTQIRSEVGRNSYTFKPVNLSPGIYMYTLGTNQNSVVKRMIIGN